MYDPVPHLRVLEHRAPIRVVEKPAEVRHVVHKVRVPYHSGKTVTERLPDHMQYPVGVTHSTPFADTTGTSTHGWGIGNYANGAGNTGFY